MSKENKVAKVPVASHGLHRHPYNYPWLSSINFGDVMPCYINTVRKGERDQPKAGVYSQLMPIAHNAFATGRFNFKAVFVPYKLVWRPWYSFDQQTEFVSNGSTSTPNRYPYVTHGVLSARFLGLYGTTSGASATYYDVVLGSPGTTGTPYLVNDAGRRILRILGALGCMPSFVDKDDRSLNILPIMCYLKAFADYYFPNNYVGNSDWLKLVKWFDRDTVAFTAFSDSDMLLEALEVASVNYYENSIFDLAWDNPASPNTYSTSPGVTFLDRTAEPSSVAADTIVDNSSSQNGTPLAVLTSDSENLTGFSQFILNALKSVSMWAKRRQLSGARLLDRFLVSRGITLGNDSARISYLLGQRNIEIEVSGVENTTDTNLGELAGRGVASSGDSPLSFSCKPDDDGIFLILVSALPDANFPVLLDGFACRKDFLDNYTAEYDKLGSAAVPSSVVHQGLNGNINKVLQNVVWGFLSQYWDEVQERPRLLGDFILKSRGAEELTAYHTFRLWNPLGGNSYHSYDFQRMTDKDQYQRLFYSSQQDNLMLFLRWYGDQFKEKLPLGDSYEWDDDEMNRKVNLVVGGSQK